MQWRSRLSIERSLYITTQKIFLHFIDYMKPKLRIPVCTVVTWMAVCVVVSSEDHFSAVVQLERLLDTQKGVVKVLEKYIEHEERKVGKMKWFLNDYDELFKSAIKDVDGFLANPINAFLLVKRLKTDWKYVLDLVYNTTSIDFINGVMKEEVFPSDDDLEESVDAVVRLHDIYLLNATELADGYVSGRKGPFELRPSDCFELGVHAYNRYEDGNLSYPWFQETFIRMDKDELQMVNESVFVSYYGYSSHYNNKTEQTLQVAKDLKELNPAHHRVVSDVISFLENKLQELPPATTLASQGELRNDSKRNHNETLEEEFTRMDLIAYKKLCRGETSRSPVQLKHLSCRYTSRGSRYLLLQPAKEETLHVDPWIVVYHDVVRESDIQIFKDLATPKLVRSTVINSETGALEFAKYRVSKNGWLADTDHPRVEHASRMVEKITGLEMGTAEPLQVNTYGLGGHYETHFDASKIGDFDPFSEYGIGDRIATWMFYLSDVEAGGATVFPGIDVQVKPIKGSAAFWWNLFKSGNPDLRTRHAACPVLHGTKWVANKWIHEREQEFRRPCALNSLE